MHIAKNIGKRTLWINLVSGRNIGMAVGYTKPYQIAQLAFYIVRGELENAAFSCKFGIEINIFGLSYRKFWGVKSLIGEF